MYNPKQSAVPTRFLPFLFLFSFITLLLLSAGCDNGPVAPSPDNTDDNQIDEIQVHDGYVGLVFDTREIFRKGYTASSVELSFAQYVQRNVTLPIDRTTNLAILSLDTDSLTTAEEAAFAEGVALEIVVKDEDEQILVSYSEDSIKLENSNQAMVLNTSAAPIAPPLALRDDLPYLIQVEGNSGVMLNFADNNSAASFDDIGAELAGIGETRGSVAWGDYDVDGDLDILVGGFDQTKVYRNDGGSFTDINANLPGLQGTNVVWGDFDNDYDLDILITGINSEFGHTSRVYRNVGGVFMEYDGANLLGLMGGSADWGDYDNDGDLDIVITGTNVHRYSLVYQNNNGVFVDIDAGLPGLHYGTAEWGDFDGDQDLDILLAGGTVGDDLCQLYENNNGSFSHVVAAEFETVPFPCVDWGDYDNDGDLDILLTGDNKTLIYRNNNNGTFLEMGAGLMGVYSGTAQWGDFDNDGDLDILLTGNSYGQVYRNDGPQGFTPIEEILEANGRSMGAWGDFDGNGAVDILLGSADGTRIFRADPGAGFDANSAYDPDNFNQEFLFVPVAATEHTYIMERPGEVDCKCWCWIEETGYLKYQQPRPAEGEPAAYLEALADDDGWMRLRLADTDSYLSCTDGAVNRLVITDGESDRFRLLSANIEWLVADRGTVFNQPIMPPARLDFAYRGTLRNCSAASFEEVIGRSEQRTSTTTTGTSESLHLFGSQTTNVQLTVGYEIKAKVGVSIGGIGSAGEEITKSAQFQVSHEWTSSRTDVTESTWGLTESTTVEVSRIRTLTLPPYSAVEVYDAVKTINNVRVPYTQVIRISATNTDTGLPLTGQEIRSQMLFNFVGGVITAIEDDCIDIGFRGYVVIDQLMHATANIDELEGGCD